MIKRIFPSHNPNTKNSTTGEYRTHDPRKKTPLEQYCFVMTEQHETGMLSSLLFTVGTTHVILVDNIKQQCYHA